jgi:thiamine biosynthesis protein ThiI
MAALAAEHPGFADFAESGLVGAGADKSAWKMMEAGYPVELIHFHNYTPQAAAVKEKMLELGRVLVAHQKPLKLYLVPFGDVQAELVKTVPADVRMIVYRRFMLRIAGVIAKKAKAKGFVTGDSLAQVASQTLDNMYVINEASPLFVHRPLLGFDKREIIDLAKALGTYEISIRPYSDCCTYMLAEHPQTHARLEEILAIEKALPVKKLVAAAAKKVEVVSFK